MRRREATPTRRGVVGRRVVVAGALGIVAGVLARGRVLRVKVGRAVRKIPRELVKFQRRDYTIKPGA